MISKKILYCEGNVDGTVGGSYYLLYDLVRNIDKKIYNPIVVFYKDNILVPKLRKAGIETYVLRRPEPFVFRFKNHNGNNYKKLAYQFLRPLQRIINIFKRLLVPSYQLARFLKKKKIDLVNLNNSITRNHEWMLAARIAKVKCMTHEMGINKSFSFLSRFLGAQLNAIISLSYEITNNMRLLGCDYPNIHTIHCGIDLSRYHITRTPEQLRKNYQIASDDPVIGVVGNIKIWKGQETVVRATGIIKQVFPNIRCFLVGGVAEADNSFWDYLKDLCVELGISENVFFTGFKKNPIDFMNFMDVVIHSSIEPEPFGIVNLEAMFLKKPVISTKIGAPTEIYENGKSGILVEPGNPMALAESCNFLLEHPDRANSIGIAAFQRLNQEFTLEKNIKKTMAIYDSIFLA